jgi:hypothetical protein
VIAVYQQAPARISSLSLHPEHCHAVIAWARRTRPEFRALLAVNSGSADFTSICNTRPIVSKNAPLLSIDRHHTLLPKNE